MRRYLLVPQQLAYRDVFRFPKTVLAKRCGAMRPVEGTPPNVTAFLTADARFK